MPDLSPAPTRVDDLDRFRPAPACGQWWAHHNPMYLALVTAVFPDSSTTTSQIRMNLWGPQGAEEDAIWIAPMPAADYLWCMRVYERTPLMKLWTIGQAYYLPNTGRLIFVGPSDAKTVMLLGAFDFELWPASRFDDERMQLIQHCPPPEKVGKTLNDYHEEWAETPDVVYTGA